MDENLLKYFIEKTDASIAAIHEKLDDLTRFKLQMLASARMTAFIISALCGIVTLVCTVAVAVYTAKQSLR